MPRGKTWNTSSSRTGDRNASTINSAASSPATPGSSDWRSINDLQMALLALPEMIVGKNAFTYTDQSPGERKVRITHEWVERSASSRRGAARGGLSARRRRGRGHRHRFPLERRPRGAEGEKIVRLPLRALRSGGHEMAAVDELLQAHLPHRGQGQGRNTRCRSAGLLTPDKQYYWHVRAKDEKGVWGPWSKTWSFTPAAPAYPVGRALDYDQDKGVGTLKWKANPVGGSR